MLKKLIKMGVVMSILLTSVSAFAQEAGRYTFRSNQSVGIAADLTWEMGQHGYPHLWRTSLNAGVDGFWQKQIDHIYAYRVRFHMPTAWRAKTDSDGKAMTRYTTLTAELLYSINNKIYGYDPDRRSNLYAFAGAGIGFCNIWMDKVFFGSNGFNKTRFSEDGATRILPAITMGLGFSYRITDNFSLYVEGDFNVNDYHPLVWQDFMDWTLTHANGRIGVIYNWGLSEADQAIAQQKSMLTQDNYDALTAQVSSLEQNVANSRNEAQRLQNRVNELERQLANAMNNQGNKVDSRAADSLQNIINQIKADQLNYYAIPFSVLYATDEWQVTDEEMDKVKAVARVMKDNSNVKIKVVGFADYTGSDAYNMKLSERRANEVKRLLTKKYGIAEDRISVDFKGENAPFGDSQYPINRRTSFYRVID